MSSQLQQFSLIQLVRESGIQRAEGRVRSTSLLEEMSLVGFIPYTDYSYVKSVLYSVDLNGHLYVAPYLVKFSEDSAHPDFSVAAPTKTMHDSIK